MICRLFVLVAVLPVVAAACGAGSGAAAAAEPSPREAGVDDPRGWIAGADRVRRAARGHQTMQARQAMQTMQALRAMQQLQALHAMQQIGGAGYGSGGDNFWSSRFATGNCNADNSAGYVYIPGTGSVSYGF